jgi:hypothetical protein
MRECIVRITRVCMNILYDDMMCMNILYDDMMYDSNNEKLYDDMKYDNNN